MTEDEFDEFVEEVTDLVSDYFEDDDDWWIENQFFGEESAYIEIEYNYDGLDDDDGLWNDLNDVANSWGSGLDWQGNHIGMGFDLD